jgi:hypothetical protein
MWPMGECDVTLSLGRQMAGMICMPDYITTYPHQDVSSREQLKVSCSLMPDSIIKVYWHAAEARATLPDTLQDLQTLTAPEGTIARGSFPKLSAGQ